MIIYTVTGGNEAVSVTQKYQMLVIFGGMVTALVVLLARLSGHLAFTDALTLAGTFHKLNAVDFSPDLRRRYTVLVRHVWRVVPFAVLLRDRPIAGAALYFGSVAAGEPAGADVQRRLQNPDAVSHSAAGRADVCLLPIRAAARFSSINPPGRRRRRDDGGKFHAVEQKFAAACAQKEQSIRAWLDARHRHDPAAETAARAQALAAHAAKRRRRAPKPGPRCATPMSTRKPTTATTCSSLSSWRNLPHGVIGLLVAAFFAAALSSKAAELSALGSTTSVDFYRHLLKRDAGEAHYVKASRWFTALWGVVALGFALFAHLQENLIQAVNIIGSVFYGVVLGLFLVAFFVRWVRGTAVFFAAAAGAGTGLLPLFHPTHISYLWYNLIGCAACVLFSILLQAAQFKKKV